MFFFESFYYFYSLKTKLFYNEMKHIRLIFSAILLSLVVPCGYAQTRQDSLAIAHAQWHTDTLQHGAVCMYTNIHVFDSPQQISIIKYDPKKYKTQIVQAPQMTMTSHLAKENQAEAAINGSYFNVKTGAPTTFIRLDGIVRGETTRAEAFRTDGAISTDKNKITDMNELYGPYQAGADLESRPPLMDFRFDDPEPSTARSGGAQ